MLETIWFILWGVLWAVYFMLDGFDLGIGTLLPFLGKSEKDRQVMYHALGPFWDGNQVWLITAGGVTFAAFPIAYAVMFSSLYSALMLLLFSLILRGVAVEFRSKVSGEGWRQVWDLATFVGSLLPAVLLGVAFANIFMGIAFDAKHVYQGTLLGLLNPYGLLGGLLFLALFCLHGSLWLANKAEGELASRALAAAKKIWPVLLLLAVAFLVATYFATSLWSNYFKYPLLLILPLLAVAGLLLSALYTWKGNSWKAWFASCLTIVGCTLFGVVGLYPNIFPSSLDPKASLTVFNASSTTLTLSIMLGVALVMVPVVILYQLWAYRTFSFKVTAEDLEY